MVTLHRTVPAPTNLGTDVSGVPEGADIDLTIRCESVVEGVLVTVVARMPVHGECVRCLDPIAEEQQVDVLELYYYPDQAVDDEEAARLEGDLLDLEPALRDAVVLALPLQPRCREDCPGLCAECGARLADEPEHQHEAVDPRWAVLHQLSGRADDAADETKEED